MAHCLFLFLQIFTLFSISDAFALPFDALGNAHASQYSRRTSPQVFSSAKPSSTGTAFSRSTGPPKYVVSSHSFAFVRIKRNETQVAHHMVGNTYPYTQEDWRDDISLAHTSGSIDAFALNVGRDDWQPARVADAYVC